MPSPPRTSRLATSRPDSPRGAGPRDAAQPVRHLVALAAQHAPGEARRILEQHTDAALRATSGIVGRSAERVVGRGEAAEVRRGVQLASTQVSRDVYQQVLTSAQAAQERAVSSLARYVATKEKGLAADLVVDNLGVKVRAARAATAYAQPRELLAKWNAETQLAIRAAVATSVRNLESPAELRARIEAVMETQRYKLERIARTETAFAFNAAQHEGIQVLAARHPDVRKRWTELVDDATGAPLDNRVAPDSLALHGQLARPGGVFTMPNDSRVSPRIQGKTYTFPPNRPNDRATILPWRPGWGVPGWEYRGGQRITR